MVGSAVPTAATKERLRGCPLFATLTEEEFRQLDTEFEWRALHAGEALFEQGSPGDCLYVLVVGRLLVSIGAGAKERIINEVQPGECVGELALLTDEPRSATVRAHRDSVLARLSRESFDRLLRTVPYTVMALNRIIVNRLRRRSEDIVRSEIPSVVSVVSATAGASASEFATELTRALSAIGNTLHVTRERINDALSAGAAASDDEIVAWLNAEEATHAFLVLEVDEAKSAWGDRCLRHADTVLVLASSDARPSDTMGIVEGLARRPGSEDSPRAELVLIHPRGVEPSGTRYWLDVFPVRRHHHVRRDRPSDVRRVVRFLTGRSVTLVLGGGGARGSAHVGVIRALEECQVPIDVFCGTSMGSFLAAAGARGLDYHAIHEAMRSFSLGSSLFDVRMSVTSFAAGKRIEEIFARTFGTRDIEDFWRPYFCISSNLTRAEAVVHQRGSASRAVRASFALPGMFPPVLEPSGDLLVDGGLVDNLPVRCAQQIFRGKTVAVNVIPALDPRIRASSEGSIGAMNVIMSKLRSREPAHPTIIDIMMRAMFLGTVHAAEQVRGTVDVYIEPPVGKYGMMNQKPYEAIAEVGYQASLPLIREWTLRDPSVVDRDTFAR